MSSPDVWSEPVTLQDGRIGRYRGKRCEECRGGTGWAQYDNDLGGVTTRRCMRPICSDPEGRYKLPPGFEPERCGEHECRIWQGLTEWERKRRYADPFECPASCAAGLVFREEEG